METIQMSPLAERIRNIALGDIDVLTVQMLENIGINADEAVVAIRQLVKAKLMKRVEGGYKAI